MEPINTLDIFRYRGGQWCREQDQIIREVPITLYVNGKRYITRLATPQHVEELALGYLVAEGYLTSAQEVKALKVGVDQDWVRVDVKHDAIPRGGNSLRQTPWSRGDGDSIIFGLQDARGLPEIDSDLVISPLTVGLLAEELQEYSRLFRETGGVHGAALASEKGDIILFREDIGRHNAIDKLVGGSLLNALDCRNKIFLTSGRVSYDTMYKTAKMGVPIIISPSAPTDMAVQMARCLRMTLVGFARGKGFNVYSGEWRLGV